jgi:alpha-1,2-mannosyltransferase
MTRTAGVADTDPAPRFNSLASAAGSRRQRRLRAAAFVGLGLVILIHAVTVWVYDGYFDLRIYQGAIRHWVDGGDLYAYTLPTTPFGYTYPPFAALVMLPLSVISLAPAAAASVAVTTVSAAAVLYWLVDPVARRCGWDRRLTLAVAGILVVAFEPLGDTLRYGQVNMLLVALVAADLVLLVGRDRKAAGMLIGLATAVKLTPGIFIVYLVVTKRWRAAAVAGGAAAAATLLAALTAPGASRTFWTDALWHTERVGSASIVNNQSLNGLVARLDPAHPSKSLVLVLALAALVVWVYRVRAAAAVGDEMTGFALTGAVACLLSPITWVHHLVWLLPAILVLVDHAYAPSTSGRRRRRLLWWAAAAYGLLCSRVIFVFRAHFTDVGMLGSNAFVVLAAVVLGGLPIRPRWVQSGSRE